MLIKLITDEEYKQLEFQVQHGFLGALCGPKQTVFLISYIMFVGMLIEFARSLL